MPTEVHLSKLAVKQIQKAPLIIKETILKWVDSVERFGLRETRRLGAKGLHDEPLSGKLEGVRSIRLSRSWRFYYVEVQSEITLVTITRVDRHKY